MKKQVKSATRSWAGNESDWSEGDSNQQDRDLVDKQLTSITKLAHKLYSLVDYHTNGIPERTVRVASGYIDEAEALLMRAMELIDI